MIKLERAGLGETRQLAGARARLAATATDHQGIALVANSGNGAWISMRPQLVAAQHRKCAYCEDYLRERMIEIDHIRPKQSSQYWWLAYSLRNLVAACRSCNNAKSHKWDLVSGRGKLVPRQEPWNVREPAMLVDPTVEDPTQHLTYVYQGDRWRIAAISQRGLWTIGALELDRDSFTLEANEFILQVIDPHAQEVQAAKKALDSNRLVNALAALKRLDRDRQRWVHLIRVVTAAAVNGEYSTPAL